MGRGDIEGDKIIKEWEIVRKEMVTSTPISSRFVFKIKIDSDGNILKYKARLVAQGFRQVYGINFYQTFSPVAKLATLRLLVAFVVINGMILEHVDVNTAYINADLDEEIWMYPPPGMDIPPDHVLLLKKSIYGLK